MTSTTSLPQTDYVDVVVGGQAGSEGKGAVVAELTRQNGYTAAVRPGSSNAGHTVYDSNDTKHVHQVIPCSAVIDPDLDLYMAAESSFGIGELFEEIEQVEKRWGAELTDRLHIDPHAGIITEEHRETERERKLGEDIGSTVHGVGAFRADKIWRSSGNAQLARDIEELEPYVGGRVSTALTEHGRADESVIVEGTQGTLLSMSHSGYYPFTTSRDCIASSFLSSCGLPPSTVRDVWLVFRTYPIRAGENSGPLHGEQIDFETVADRAGYDSLQEFASVTGRKRRIFEWSWEEFEFAVQLNDPDKVALTFLDYLDAENYGAKELEQLTPLTLDWIQDVDRHLDDGVEVGLLKTGPKAEHVIDVRGTALNH